MHLTQPMQFAFLLALIALCLALTGANGYAPLGVFVVIPVALIFGLIGLFQKNTLPPGP
jgi:hypothetical protein